MSKAALIVVAAAILAGCTGTPPLDPRPAGNPMGVDLSGQWELRTAAAPRRVAEQTIRIPRSVNTGAQPGAQPGERPRSRRSRSDGGSLHVFLVSGNALKITQTEYGLFFSFDRAVVEEYNFGENRKVNVGPIEAQRVAGWDGNRFIAETMDEDGYVLTESWRLDADGALLQRDISITRDAKTEFEDRQVFVRAQSGV